MPLPFNAPIATSGKIILVATATMKEGQADKAQELLAAVRKAAETEEKGTLTYRTTRGEGEHSNTFVIFEEYVLPDGIQDHVDNAPFQALASAGVLAELDIKYYNEFQ